MTNSATMSPAEVRRQKTAHRLTSVCRTLAAERGLSGFTIEEVCSEVGVSRRTFFNYFASKEDGVFGIDEEDELRRFAEDFLARGSRGWGAAIDDILDLGRQHARSADEHLELMRVLDREPRLLARFIGMSNEREAGLRELVAAREASAPDAPEVRAVVAVITTVLRSTGERLSDPAVAADFPAALSETLTAIRAVLND